MRAMEQARAAADEGKKGKRQPEARQAQLATLKREAERLRAELASEQKRVRTLEDTNGRVAERLDEAIQSVKAMLAKQD